MTPTTEITASAEASGRGERLGVPLRERHVEPFGGRPRPSSLEQGRHVVDPGHLAAAAGGGERCVPASGGHVDDAGAGPQVGRVAELLGHEDDPAADGAVVAAGPGLSLPILDRLVIGNRGLSRRHRRS
jgi:hypothetical protein